MRRAVLIAALGALLLGGGASLWAGRDSAVSLFVLPGATDLATSWRGLGTVRVTYHLPGEPFSWRTQLARRLESEGWTGRSYSNMGARRPPFSTIWYTNEIRLGPIGLVERAILGGSADTPNLAIVEVTRELRIGR